MNVRKFKFLRRKSWVGKLLRLPFKLIPQDMILPIVSGPLRGKSWIKGSHNLSVLLGTYERLQTREFYKAVKNVNVFWDLGAHVGYYSLLFRNGNPEGKIIGFEPVERNGTLFNVHMRLNHVANVVLHNKGVSDQSGILTFDSGGTTVAGRLSADGNISVEVVKLSAWLEDGLIEIPQLVKMDIEGEEYKVLCDLGEMLRQHKPSIFLSTHGPEVHLACIKLLKECNYAFKPLDTLDLESCREVLAY